MGTATKQDKVSSELLEELVESNPHVDAQRLRDGLRAVQVLYGEGFTKAEYTLASPYGHSGLHSADERDWSDQDA